MTTDVMAYVMEELTVRKSTGLISVLVLGAALSVPATAAQAAPAAASVSTASACHGLIVKGNSRNNKAISASEARSYKKAEKYNHSARGKLVNALNECKSAHDARVLRRIVRDAATLIEDAEHLNRKAYVEHDRGAGKRALYNEYDAQRKLHDAIKRS
ncbi:hypothetical protein CP981_26320 [Streptomyces platensis]|uniref:Uncharacterized protein n=1 Tax=Streptomyces platensis TaxID=58346 RepID=A0AAE6NMS7_STRPT|nr:hypothetical protein [Streptomyces platensis]OSY47620.1 hypothetical protein BG653_00875 [Streptomyces platensis]QEV54680.1 hypothetical protein CP981_26320 [Streptomyces platensis]